MAEDTEAFIQEVKMHRTNSSQEVDQARASLLLDYETANNELKELSVEVSEEVKAEVEWSHQFFQSRAKSQGVTLTKRVLYFIDMDNKDKVADILGQQFRGVNLRDTKAFSFGNISVVFKEEQESDLDLAADAFHELDHSYSYFSFSRASDKNIKAFVHGGNIVTNQGESLGLFFEEGSVRRDTEDYFILRGSRSFPEKYKEKRAVRDYASKGRQDAIRFGSIRHSVEGDMFGAEVYEKTNNLSLAYELLSQNIPALHYEITAARVTGKWGEVARMVDKKLGRGAFKLLEQVSKDNLTTETSEYLLNYVKGTASSTVLNVKLLEAKSSSRD